MSKEKVVYEGKIFQVVQGGAMQSLLRGIFNDDGVHELSDDSSARFCDYQYQIQSSLLRGKLRSEARTARVARTPKNTPKAMIRINMISSFLRTVVRN